MGPFKIMAFFNKRSRISDLIEVIKLYKNSAKKDVPFTGRYRLTDKGVEFELSESWFIKQERKRLIEG